MPITLTPFQQLLRAAAFFPGEFDLLADEFCGQFRVALEQVPMAKQYVIADWLSYPIADRKRAFDAVKEKAVKPIHMALDLLKNPEKYQPKAKPSAQDKNLSAIAAFLDDEE